MAHAIFSPSAAERWIACPGSVLLSENCPKTSSKYADEGTAAHMLAEKCINQKKQAAEFIGTVIEVIQDAKVTSQIAVTEEMAENVQVYLDHVADVVKATDFFYIEEKLDLSWVVPDCFGTADFWAFDKKSGTLYVSDLKFGKGKEVEVFRNSQQMLYAIGAVYALFTKDYAGQSFTDLSKVVRKVVITIVQPRKYHEEGAVRSWETTAADLMFWARNIAAPAAHEASKPNAHLECGEHCQFCPALAVCKAFNAQAMELAKSDFDSPQLPDPASLTKEEVIKILKMSDLITSWAAQVEAYAQTLLEKGEEVPGFKLVQKRSNRKWSAEEQQIISALQPFIGPSVYKPVEVISVAEAEKALKKHGIMAESVLAGLYEKPDAGVVIAPVSDKRAAVSIEASPAEFLEDAAFLN